VDPKNSNVAMANVSQPNGNVMDMMTVAIIQMRLSVLKVVEIRQPVHLVTLHVPMVIACLGLGYVMKIMTVEITQMKNPSNAVRNYSFCL